MIAKKKLIEVALPLEAINKASAREKSIRHGHPSTLHLWWARRPLAAARAVIFAQMVDDPSSHPDIFPNARAQEKERRRLFKILEQLVLWENTTNQQVLKLAQDEIWQSWRYTCAENADHIRAKELFDRHKLPAFHDPFAGGGSLPLEAQRLGIDSYASELNPVAVLINKAMIEIPPRFANRPPVNQASRSSGDLVTQPWPGARGLADDVRYYGRWMRDEAERRIGHLYGKVQITPEMAVGRRDLEPYIGRSLTVIAWLWARTVKSPNPAFAQVDVPLASTFMLSTKPGHEAYVEPVISNSDYRFTVRVGKPRDPEIAKNGTKLSQGTFRCIMSNSPFRYEYIDDQANSGRMGERLMAVVVEGDRERLYLPPSDDMERTARSAHPSWKPDAPSRGTWASNAQGRIYGFRTIGDYFTPRQLTALTTLSDLVSQTRERIALDAKAAGVGHDSTPVRDGGQGASAYAEAVSLYLAFALDKTANIGSSIASWMSDRGAFRETFARQGIPMVWDYAESNPFAETGGSFLAALEKGALALEALPATGLGLALQVDAVTQTLTADKLVSTDPPYYDNIGYADLSDFFYVWLRRSMRSVFPDLFATVAVPKEAELVASAYRHGGKAKADAFFLEGMTAAMHRLADSAHPAFPITIYYAFKQSETEGNGETSSTGWDTFLRAVIDAGLSISGTWPLRTEGAGRITALDSNALATSILLVCRRRETSAATTTRREFVEALKAELPTALIHLQAGNIAPVDLQQAILGPGMAIFTRYASVIDAAGRRLSVREALALINQALDEALSQQEGDFDADSRWAVVWFEQKGFADGEYGLAEQLSKSKNTSVEGMVEAGFLKSSRGKVRLLKPSEMAADWDPETDTRLSAWETLHQLIRAHSDGDAAVATLVAKLGSRADNARQLAYRLYTLCDRKKRTAEAAPYNALILAWPEIIRLAQGENPSVATQAPLFAETEA